MATNVELERQLRAAEKNIEELRGEVKALQEVCGKTFRELGASAMWRQAQQVSAKEIAATINETVPQRTSVVPNKADLERMSTEIFGRPLPTTQEIQEMIAATTAKG